jgi:hypothetical protein
MNKTGYLERTIRLIRSVGRAPARIRKLTVCEVHMDSEHAWADDMQTELLSETHTIRQSNGLWPHDLFESVGKTQKPYLNIPFLHGSPACQTTNYCD